MKKCRFRSNNYTYYYDIIINNYNSPIYHIYITLNDLTSFSTLDEIYFNHLYIDEKTERKQKLIKINQTR